jgi:hypothetical protein
MDLADVVVAATDRPWVAYPLGADQAFPHLAQAVVPTAHPHKGATQVGTGCGQAGQILQPLVEVARALVEGH